MFDRYTDEAKRAIFFARIEATHRNEVAITLSDILLGLTWEDECRACRTARLKQQAVTIRAAVGVPHLPCSSTPYFQREIAIPLDPIGKKVIAYAAHEANRDFSYWIGSDHLLRGVLRVSGAARDCLEGSGITLESVREASKAVRRQHPDRPVPRDAYIKALMANRWTVVAMIIIFAFLMLAYFNSVAEH